MSYRLVSFFYRTYKCDVCKKEKSGTRTKDFVVHDIPPEGWHHIGDFDGFTLCDTCYDLINDYIKVHDISEKDWFVALYNEAKRRMDIVR